MKKLTIIIATLSFITTSVFAQPRKGDWMVGAGIANSSAARVAGSTQFNVNLNPSAGYFLSNRVAVGTSVGLSYSKYARSLSSYSASLKPFARYYFSKKEGMQPKKLYLFGEVSAGAGIGASRYDNNGVIEKRTGSTILSSAGLGLTYFILPNVSVEGTFNMNYNTPINAAPAPGSNLVPSLGVGFQIYLPGRKKVRAQEE